MIETTRTQDWYLHGIPSMHRVLVRRTVDAIAADQASKIIWRTDRQLPSKQQWFQPDMPRVILVDLGLWMARPSERWGLDRFGESTRTWSNESIRILWALSATPGSDQSWALGVGFAGVISEVSHLRTWCQTAVAKGPAYDGQHNRLLQDLVLPSIGV